MKLALKPKRPGPRAKAPPIFVRLSPEERAEVVAAAEREAMPLAVWARSRLLLAARSPKARADRSTPT